MKGFTATEISAGLHVLPASYSFENTEDVPLETYSSALHSAVRTYRETYDYIFLDAEAGSDEFAAVAISEGVSDRVVIVSEYDPMSAAGMERLKAISRDDMQYHRTWVLLNKMLPEFVKSFRDFMEVARYLSPIPWNAEVVRAYARRSLALDLAEGNEYTLAIVQALRSLLDRVEGAHPRAAAGAADSPGGAAERSAGGLEAQAAPTPRADLNADCPPSQRGARDSARQGQLRCPELRGHDPSR